MRHFVLGDIGGTNCRLAVTTEQGRVLIQRNHSTHQMSTLIPALEELCTARSDLNVVAGAVAVVLVVWAGAGLVQGSLPGQDGGWAGTAETLLFEPFVLSL